jgi:signal peptidase I
MPPEAATVREIQPLRMPVQPRTAARRRGRGVGIGSTVLLSCAVLLVILVASAMLLDLVRFTVVDSGSMRPTLNPGDVVVLRSERAADIGVGQIVAFHPPGEKHLTVIHRVRSIRRTRTGIIFRTKGDANNAGDPWRARIAGDTVWRESMTVPLVGYLVVWSQQPAVRMAMLTLIMALVVSLSLGWIWRPTSEARRAALS